MNLSTDADKAPDKTADTINQELLALLDRYLAGDQEAAETFFCHISRMLHPLIWSSANSLGIRISSDDVRDLNQKIIEKLLANDARRLRRFKRNSRIKTWLRVITDNTLIDHVRKKDPLNLPNIESIGEGNADQDEGAMVDPSDDGPSPSELVEAAESRQLVIRACQTVLSEEEQLIIKLWCRYAKEREIAAQLHMNPNTVATRIRRAKAKILGYLKDHTT